MFEWISLTILGLLGLGLLLFPFRTHLIGASLFGLSLGLALWMGYLQVGNWQALQRAHQLDQAKALLASFHTVDEVIERLKSRLDHQPSSAKGWFLLGRLYASQGRKEEAKAAFLEAKRLRSLKH